MGKLNMINKNTKQNQGQVVIIVLFVSAIILSWGLAAAKKTTTDTKVAIDEELLKEAFNVAESGINNYLLNPSQNGEYNASDGSKAIVTKEDIGGANVLSSEGLILSNTNQLFWLVDHNADGSLGLAYYAKNTNLTLTVDSTFTGALKIDYYFKNGASYTVNRIGYNFHQTNVTVTNYSNIAEKLVTINTGAGDPVLIIVTPIGASTNLSLAGSNNFPIQGEELTSVGTANNGVTTQIKTRNVYQIPSFFNEAITAKNVIQ